MVALVNALKWLATFLESRYPVKVTPVSKDVFDEEIITLHRHDAITLEEIEKLKKQIEILNLRVGLSRPIQTVLGDKKWIK